MKLTVIGSGSTGNGYVIQNESEALILEAGMPLDKAKQALGFNVGKVAACLITHNHNDHSGRAKEYEMVFPTFANSHVIQSKGLKWTTELKAGEKITVGRFRVLPFVAEHDVPCLGFLINHPEIGNLVFLTDSFLCEYSFVGLNHILIECNYSDEALSESIANGLHPSMRDRLMTTHMELQTCKKVLMGQDLTEVYTILLIHLSSHNSDERQFIETITRATGKPVLTARSGLEIELENKPY